MWCTMERGYNMQWASRFTFSAIRFSMSSLPLQLRLS